MHSSCAITTCRYDAAIIIIALMQCLGSMYTSNTPYSHVYMSAMQHDAKAVRNSSLKLYQLCAGSTFMSCLPWSEHLHRCLAFFKSCEIAPRKVSGNCDPGGMCPPVNNLHRHLPQQISPPGSWSDPSTKSLTVWILG